MNEINEQINIEINCQSMTKCKNKLGNLRKKKFFNKILGQKVKCCKKKKRDPFLQVYNFSLIAHLEFITIIRPSRIFKKKIQ